MFRGGIVEGLDGPRKARLNPAENTRANPEEEEEEAVLQVPCPVEVGSTSLALGSSLPGHPARWYSGWPT